MADVDAPDGLVIQARRHYHALQFNERECSVADLLLTGLTATDGISVALGIPHRTVRNVLQRMCHKAGVHTRTQLVIRLLSVSPLSTDNVDQRVTPRES